MTVKFEPLVAVPDGVVTVILPVVAPAGTVAVTRPSFTKLKLADVPLNRTLVAPVKWLPLMVTDVPTAPLDGEKPLIVGAAPPVTVKFDALVAVPDGVVTVILPVVAPAGTLVVIRPSFATLKLADVPLNRTLRGAGEVVAVDGDRGAHHAARRREAADRRSRSARDGEVRRARRGSRWPS